MISECSCPGGTEFMGDGIGYKNCSLQGCGMLQGDSGFCLKCLDVQLSSPSILLPSQPLLYSAIQSFLQSWRSSIAHLWLLFAFLPFILPRGSPAHQELSEECECGKVPVPSSGRPPRASCAPKMKGIALTFLYGTVPLISCFVTLPLCGLTDSNSLASAGHKPVCSTLSDELVSAYPCKDLACWEGLLNSDVSS